MRQRPRFTFADDGAPGINGTVRVTGGEFHHMRDVMRLAPGAEIELCGHNGLNYAGRIARFEQGAAVIDIAQSASHESVRPRVILAAGIIKPARMDLLIEKAAELDASEFWPLKCTRSVMNAPSSGRQERWRRIVNAAAKQSLSRCIMQIHDPVDITEMVAKVPKAAVPIICVQGAEPISTVIRGGAANPDTVVMVVGPEGDFTDAELTIMREAGFRPAALGRNRLRSETAAIAALSIVTGILAERENTAYTARPRV
ncbi:MAG TPA: RsmE family RNA methyltransferase [Candidatus Binataceae bacterium]|nr:RsmE family RNA methyltransferase [Candidatus Binataceae bacterium]